MTVNVDLRDKVILINENDEALGQMDKLEAHQKGVLHRAFSVFIFNSKGEILLHQRAQNKYHGASLWTNACCSHPQWDEDLKESAKERLSYEMGLDCNIEKAFHFIYKTPVENNLIEHELDHVFIGYTDEDPNPNPEEADDFKWMNPEALKIDIKKYPEKYTHWFKLALPKVLLFC